MPARPRPHTHTHTYPQPFTHVSGYANRFKEMLKHLHHSGDKVEICTADDVPDAPDKFLDYRIHYTPGFRYVRSHILSKKGSDRVKSHTPPPPPPSLLQVPPIQPRATDV